MSECLRVAYSCQQSKKKNMLIINQGWIYLGQIYIFWMKKNRAGVNLFRHTSFNMYMHYVPQFINKILHFQAKKKLYKNDPKLPDKNSYSATHIQHCLDPIVFRSNLKGDFLVFLPPRDHLSSSHYLQIFFHENSKTYFFKVRGGPRVS